MIYGEHWALTMIPMMCHSNISDQRNKAHQKLIKYELKRIYLRYKRSNCVDSVSCKNIRVTLFVSLDSALESIPALRIESFATVSF